VLENHNDAIHPAFVHASSIWAAREQAKSAEQSKSDERSTSDEPSKSGAPSKSDSDGYAEIAIRQMLQNGAPAELWEGTGLWAAPYGHSFMGDYHTDDRLVTALDHPLFREYRAALERRVGRETASRILGVSRWNSIVYPSCSFMSQFRQLRIVQPLAVDRTLVSAYSFRLGGAPEQMFRDTVAFANIVNGTGSPVLTDDLEVYERAQHGLTTARSDWVYLGRGHGGDVPDEHRTWRGKTGTSEIHIRNQLAAWVRYLTDES